MTRSYTVELEEGTVDLLRIGLLDWAWALPDCADVVGLNVVHPRGRTYTKRGAISAARRSLRRRAFGLR